MTKGQAKLRDHISPPWTIRDYAEALQAAAEKHPLIRSHADVNLYVQYLKRWLLLGVRPSKANRVLIQIATGGVLRDGGIVEGDPAEGGSIQPEEWDEEIER